MGYIRYTLSHMKLRKLNSWLWIRQQRKNKNSPLFHNTFPKSSEIIFSVVKNVYVKIKYETKFFSGVPYTLRKFPGVPYTLEITGV